MQKKQKLFTGCYCFFCIHESSISSLKIKAQKLPQSAVPQPEPFVLRPQLADCCHFTFSLFFMLLFKGGVRSVFMNIYWVIITEEQSFLLPWCKRNKRSSLNSFIPKIIGRIFLSQPQPLVFHTRLGGCSLRPPLKSLPWFFGIKL